MNQADIAYLATLYANDSARQVYLRDLDSESNVHTMFHLHVTTLDTLAYAMLHSEETWLESYVSEATNQAPEDTPRDDVERIVSHNVYLQIAAMLHWALNTQNISISYDWPRVFATISYLVDVYNECFYTEEKFDIMRMTEVLKTDPEPYFEVE